MERILRYNLICDEKLPLVKIRKNTPKSKISLSQLLIKQRYTKLTSRYMFFVDDKYDEIS